MNAKGMKKKFLIWGLIIQAIGQGAFLVLDIIEDENIFILVSILGRLIVGAVLFFYIINLIFLKKIREWPLIMFQPTHISQFFITKI